MRRPLLLACLALSLACLPGRDSEAGCHAGRGGHGFHPFRAIFGHRARQVPPPMACSYPAAIPIRAVPAPGCASGSCPAPQVSAPSGDASGFIGWLNAYRAGAGLGPVGYDAGLASDAAINSSHGFGHSFMGRARRQNVGVGAGPTVWAMWTASPAHNSALLDPTITVIGLASNGGVWTFSAR